MIILFSPYLPSHDQDDYALCWVFKKNTICMCIMALLEGACHQQLTSGSIEYQTPEERRPPRVWPWPAENEALICSTMLQMKRKSPNNYFFLSFSLIEMLLLASY